MLMLYKSLEITPFAALSRPCCGIRNKTLIINLPGSPKGACENLINVLPIIPHAIKLLQSENENTNIQNINEVRQSRSSKFEMISEKHALKLILNEIQPHVSEEIDITKYFKKCYASSSIHSNQNIPNLPTSIKDGYAINIDKKSIDDNYPVTYDNSNLNDLMLFKISTGSIVPQQYNAVIQVEDTKLIDWDKETGIEKTIKVLSYPVLKGHDIRKIGNDLKVGDLIIDKGDLVSPQIIGTLCSIGIISIHIFKPPKIAILSTGDEIFEPNCTDLQPGNVRDSNRFLLLSLLHRYGFSDNLIDLGIVPDNVEELAKAITHAISLDCDLIISSGGVSMGHKDYMKPVITDELKGKILFGRVNIKPGLPTTFATIPKPKNSTDGASSMNQKNPLYSLNRDPKLLIFSLPGNPVSTFAMFHIFVLPAIHKLAGDTNNDCLIRLKAKLKENLTLDSRPEYRRGYVKFPAFGHGQKEQEHFAEYTYIPEVISTGSNQMSSNFKSLHGANCLIYCPQKEPNRQLLYKNEIVDLLLLTQ